MTEYDSKNPFDNIFIIDMDNAQWKIKIEKENDKYKLCIQKINSFEYYETYLNEKENERIKSLLMDNNTKLIEENEMLLIQNTYYNFYKLNKIWNNENGKILWEKYKELKNEKEKLEKEKKELEEKLKKQNDIKLDTNKNTDAQKSRNNHKNGNNLNNKYNIINKNTIISLGINIGASKTVYSIFSKINNKYVLYVILKIIDYLVIILFLL